MIGENTYTKSRFLSYLLVDWGQTKENLRHVLFHDFLYTLKFPDYSFFFFFLFLDVDN